MPELTTDERLDRLEGAIGELVEKNLGSSLGPNSRALRDEQLARRRVVRETTNAAQERSSSVRGRLT